MGLYGNVALMVAWAGPGWPEIGCSGKTRDRRYRAPDPKPWRARQSHSSAFQRQALAGIPMSYYERSGPALEHEEMVLQWLRYEGCIAEPWGRALFPIAIQEALRTCQDADGNPVLLRWFPDIHSPLPSIGLPDRCQARRSPSGYWEACYRTKFLEGHVDT